MRRITMALLCLAVGACSGPKTHLERVQDRGELIVATRNSPTTYYEGPRGPEGFEYDLANRFADYLGVELRMVVPERFNEILPMVANRDVDMAAAGLTVTEERKRRVRFGPAYQHITQQVVYAAGARRPRDVDALRHGILEVIAGSSHEERLEELRQEHPKLDWQTNGAIDSEELLHLVAQRVVDYTVLDSNQVAIHRRYYPELRVAFDLTAPQPLAWAFPPGRDDTLQRAAADFFDAINRDGTLTELLERYYGHIQDFDYVGTRRYMLDIQYKLPRYEPTFRQAAKDTGLDWRLLAAIGYQESHWNPDAVSPTGVRGIMMLTRQTARILDIEDRVDPQHSIMGGARYFKRVKAKLPERIEDPDRTWLALAAYNVGLGHLEDVRILTQRAGDDPDKWMDVKEHLPKLSQKKWYRKTRYGYARGREPVRYVENIRSYYDVLTWYTDRERQYTPERQPVQIDSPPL